MKLPGITYSSVQQLGREDIGAPIRAASAIGSAMQQTAQVLGDIYEKQSVTQAEKALLEYDTGMANWSQNQQPYQEDGTGTWIKGDELYDSAEESNRKEATKELQTPMARAIFDRKFAQRSAENKTRWGAQQLGWMRADELGTAVKAYEDYKNTRQWAKAKETIDRQVTIGNMSPPDGARRIQEVDYLANYYVHSDAVDGVENAETGRITIESIKKDITLQEKDQNTLIKATEDRMLQSTTDRMFSEMTVVAEEIGLEQAVALGETIFADLRDTEAEDLGSDENFKLATLNRADQVISTFRSQLVKATSESLRLADMNRVKAGIDPASADVNHQQYNDWYAVDVLGWQLHGGGSDYVRTTPQTAIYTDPQVATNTISFIGNYGVIPKTADDALLAALQAGRGKDGLAATMQLHAISQASPEAMFKRKNHAMNAIASQAEILGGSETAYQIAYDNYLKVRDMDDEMKKTFYNAQVFNEEFESEFDDALKQQFPVDNPWYAFWTDAVPEVRRNYVDRIKAASKTFLPYTNGETAPAIRMAMYSMRAAFGPSKANGETAQLMENPPEMFVPNANYDGGNWLREQTEIDVKANWGEEYETGFVRAEPAPYFSPNDPAYILYDYNPEIGFVRQLGVMKYDFAETPYFAEQQIEAERQAKINAAEKERQRRVVEYELNQNPENKQFYPTPSGKGAAMPTPYGALPKQGPIGREVQRYQAGQEVMSEQGSREAIQRAWQRMIYGDQERPKPERLPYPGG